MEMTRVKPMYFFFWFFVLKLQLTECYQKIRVPEERLLWGSTMDYSLGSFTKYGHQARGAEERRQRAIANSILSRQIQADNMLSLEIDTYNWLSKIVNGIEPNTKNGEKLLRNLVRKMETIGRTLESGKRVYFKRLGKILHSISTSTENPFPSELDEKNEDEMACIMEYLARQGLPRLTTRKK